MIAETAEGPIQQNPASGPLANSSLVELIYDARADRATVAVRHSGGSLKIGPQDGWVDGASAVRRPLRQAIKHVPV